MKKVLPAGAIILAATIVVTAFLFNLLTVQSPGIVVANQTGPKIRVSLKADGIETEKETIATTVGSFLKEQGINLGKYDEVYPGLQSQLKSGFIVNVMRVEHKFETVTEPVSYRIITKVNRDYRPGITKIIQSGYPGVRKKVFLVIKMDGKETAKKAVSSTVTIPSKDQIVMVGDSSHVASRGYFSGRRILTMYATGYDPGPGSCGKYASGRTSAGLKAGYGVVAVDPRVIPIGTRLFIEGYGYAVAGDVGSAIKGNRIDLGHDSRSEALKVGRKAVKVHVLD